MNQINLEIKKKIAVRIKTQLAVLSMLALAGLSAACHSIIPPGSTTVEVAEPLGQLQSGVAYSATIHIRGATRAKEIMVDLANDDGVTVERFVFNTQAASSVTTGGFMTLSHAVRATNNPDVALAGAFNSNNGLIFGTLRLLEEGRTKVYIRLHGRGYLGRNANQ